MLPFTAVVFVDVTPIAPPSLNEIRVSVVLSRDGYIEVWMIRFDTSQKWGLRIMKSIQRRDVDVEQSASFATGFHILDKLGR
jgi:hypothetical protein